MSFTAYVTENILKPANLTNTYYWVGGQGMEPQGLRKNVISLPSYTTTFQNSSGGESASPISNQAPQLLPSPSCMLPLDQHLLWTGRRKGMKPAQECGRLPLLYDHLPKQLWT